MKNINGNPLNSSTYLIRNAGKTLPLTGVIVLAVLLIAGIVSMINSIPLSIKVIYSYSQNYLALTPRGDAELTAELEKIITNESPVPVDRMMRLRGTYIEVKSIVGNWPFVVVFLKPGDVEYYIERMGGGKLHGRLPEQGKPEIVISEPLARNLGYKLGSIVLGPETTDAYSPQEVKVVGIVDCPEWFTVSTFDYHVNNHFPPIDSILVFAENAKDQKVLDDWAEERFKGLRAQIFTYRQLEEQADTMFSILYKILNVVIGTLVVVITMMMGMLINIYLSQRIQEFGLLQALGYTRATILKRVLSETALVVIGGWGLGVGVAYGLLNLVKVTLMDPRAFALDTLDKTAFLYTVPVPITIFIVAGLTVIARFKKFDPVSVVERRLV